MVAPGKICIFQAERELIRNYQSLLKTPSKSLVTFSFHPPVISEFVRGTSAMEAGLTKDVMTIGEIVRLAD